MSNRGVSSTVDSSSETLGYKSKHYNSTDFFPKYKARAQVLTDPYLSRACGSRALAQRSYKILCSREEPKTNELSTEA